MVDINLSADDWDLYTREPGVEGVAASLNIRFNECVNMNMTRQETVAAMDKEMRLYRAWGASDSEPLYVLEQLLNEVY